MSQHADGLRAALEAPTYNRTLRREVGRGDLDYEIYVRTQELLSLQNGSEELVIPDELAFQIMHQTQELWMKLMSFEVVGLIASLDEDKLWEAVATLDRINRIAGCLAREIDILDTLSPERFHVIRRNLGNGSGLESPGYNHLQLATAAAGAALDRALERRGLELRSVYEEGGHADLEFVCERMLDWDERLQEWLHAHFMLVRRTLGVDRTVKALDGFPTAALAPRMTRPFFPRLWEVRVEMTQGWRREGGHLPGAPRSA